jgi:hypothetical protein
MKEKIQKLKKILENNLSFMLIIKRWQKLMMILWHKHMKLE